MKKNIITLLFCLAGLMFPTNSFADDEAPVGFNGLTTWYDYREPITEGQGSMADPILISTAGQLAQLAYNVNTGAETYKNKVVALGADIDLNKEVDGQRVQWVPIGYDPLHTFQGLFMGLNVKDFVINSAYQNGQKHKISGLHINVTSAEEVKHFGLFGVLDGNVSHLQLEDVSISVDLSALSETEYYFVGGLCGSTATSGNNSGGADDLWFRGKYYDDNDPSHVNSYYYVNHAIDDVAVSGSLSATGNENAVTSVGGICGQFDILGVIHSTINITINTSNCDFVGGVCGVDNGLYDKTTGNDGNCLYDCVANATITCNDNITRSIAVGGIVGRMAEGEKAYACVSMGTIRCNYTPDNTTAIYNVGGICGDMQPYSGIFASGSMMMIKAQGNIGGITGKMKSGSKTDFSQYGKIECCTFSGHLDGSNKIVDENGQTTGVESGGLVENYVGGICGHLEWNDEIDHITRCLLLGTMVNGDFATGAPLPSATVGKQGTDATLKGSHWNSTVTYCYYDKLLFNGNAIPGSKEGGNAAKGLTTTDLTSANMTKLTWLNPGDTEPDKYGFRLEKGYYPIFYENNGSQATYYSKYTIRTPYYVVLKSLFDFYPDDEDHANMNSTVYVPGALLCSMPVSFVKGDCAGDFVSTMSAPTKTYNWEEKGTGRKVIMTCETFFPETDVLKVNNKTATAYNNGSCFVTTTGTVRKKEVVFNRPLIMSGIKYLFLNSTVDNEWDGTEAIEFADGTGTAADPYIIKNASQLYHAIKTNRTGQFYKQLCDIIITKSVNREDETIINNTLITEACLAPGIPYRHNNYNWTTHSCTWNANYNGNGHTVSGLYLNDYLEQAPTTTDTYFSLFGNVAADGSVNNLAVVDTWIGPEPLVFYNPESYSNENLKTHYGIIASNVFGSITNCIVQGINAVGRPCGGICAYVGIGGKVEDCISAVVPQAKTLDLFTPFVAYDIANNSGSVTNCLAVIPTTFSSADKSSNNLSAVQNCYWLKGYEPGNTGFTLDEIGAALGGRDKWTWTQNYFPTLKTFAEKDIAKLMMVPVRTDKDYEFDESTQTAANYLYGFTKMLEFEPGAATWTSIYGDGYMEADSELGIVAPANSMPTSGNDHFITPLEAICASLGESFYYIPMRTNSGDIQRGITFVDPHAERACVLAFDSKTGPEKDGRLSLAELRAITTEQTLTAFKEADVQLQAQQIKQFPEFRFFKAVTTLTEQLSGLNNLEEVRLPYNLQVISGDQSLSGNGIRPFSMTQIKDITLPGKVTSVEPGAFSGSEVENIYVDPFNTKFVSRDGILFDKNNALVSFPNGRITSDEIIIPGVIDEIKTGAVYDITSRLQKVFFDTTDYSTVAYYNDNGFFIFDGSLPDVYISDATYGSILFNEYLDDESWEDYAEADKLHCYYPLKIGDAKAGTMYIGFDTELPAGLYAYIVTSEDEEAKKAYLKKKGNLIPNRSPIVIFADEAGTYRLFPLQESLQPWNMYENQLNGVGRDGMEVYQSDSDRGSILTLGRNSEGTLGFFYYKGTAPIPPYRAYLTYEWVSNAKQYLLFYILDDESTGITQHLTPNAQQQDWYTLDGRRINGQPAKRGIYIRGGKKYVVK